MCDRRSHIVVGTGDETQLVESASQPRTHSQSSRQPDQVTASASSTVLKSAVDRQRRTDVQVVVVRLPLKVECCCNGEIVVQIRFALCYRSRRLGQVQ